MKIAIDCRMLGMSGIGNYLKGCLSIMINSNNEFLLFGDENKILPLVNEYSNYKIFTCNIKPFTIKDIIFFNKKFLKIINFCDIYYSPYFNIPSGIKIPVFLTIHDIVFLDMPELVSFIGFYIRFLFYKRAINLSNVIFTISDFSKNRIEYHFGTKKTIINASNSIINDNFNNNNIITKKNYILFIGNIKKHKGLNILLTAFFSAIKDGLKYKLIIIGEKDNFRSSENNIILNNEPNVIFTGYISDSEKNQYLAESALLVQPSLYEGFGYPPMEAMFSGTNVLISDIPVFKEIYKDYPVTFFKSGDSIDLKNKLLNLLHNKTPAVLKLPLNLKEKYNFKKTVAIILSEMEKYNNK